MTKVEPGTPVIYERVDYVVYGRFANRPDIPRWVVQDTTPRVNGLTSKDFAEIIKLSETNSTLKAAVDKMATIYYIIKDGKHE